MVRKGEPEIKATIQVRTKKKEERVNRPEFDDPYKSHAIRDPRLSQGKRGMRGKKKLRRAHDTASRTQIALCGPSLCGALIG